MEYGNVQRGVLGVEGAELNSTASKEFGVKLTQGFYVTAVSKKSGAEKAGLRKGDIIVQLDNQPINSYADMSSYVNTKRPNDIVIAGIIREGSRKDIKIELTKRELLNYDFNGLELEDIGAAEKKMFNINYGVKIKDITSGNLLKYANDLKGSIILNIDGAKATDIETVSQALSRKGEGQSVRMELITRKGALVQVITQ